MDAGRTFTRKGSGPSRTIWAYAYQIVPPQTKSRLRPVRDLLDREPLAAQPGSRTWAGKLILGTRMTCILIVSDSLERSRRVNQRLDAELKQLNVGFSVTAPVALPPKAVSKSR